VRLLFRWHTVRRRDPRIPVVAIATAIAMVGALILESGIVARTPDVNSSLASTTAGLGVPGTLFNRLDRILAVDQFGMPRIASAPGSIAPLDVTREAFLQAQQSDPVTFLEWMARYFALAQQVARDSALTSASGNTALDPLIPGWPALVAATSASSAPTQPAPKPTPKPTPKPAPKPAPNASPPVHHGGGPDGIWNVAPIVTWYGPGFYGNRTACGQRYTRTINGDAHRTLPCGSLIEFRWHGITAVAPVIDRGPYASSAYVFDWSAALACRVFKPKGVSNSCFTRYDVQWRIVGRRKH
jgi:hypothetical protein